jgi:acyl-CoA reductase-like NAD-dependent aldehyde dehydrogenase
MSELQLIAERIAVRLFSRQVSSGAGWVETPFGGRKSSGFGSGEKLRRPKGILHVKSVTARI